MAERTYRLLSDSRLQATQSRAGAQLRRWSIDWGIDPEAFQVRVTRLADGAVPHADGWRRSLARRGWAWALPSAELQAAIGAAMFGGEPPGPLGAACAADAIAALEPSVAGHEAAGPLLEPPHAGDDRVFVEVVGTATVLAFVEPADPPAAVRRSALPALSAQDRDAALRRVRARPRVELGDTDLTLRELVDLRSGQVVVLDQSVRHPVRIVCAESGAELLAHLGRDGDRFAVQAIRPGKTMETTMNKDLHGGTAPDRHVHDVDLEELESRPTGDAPLLDNRLSLFAGVRARVTALVGHADTSVGELLALKEGETFRLDRHVDAPIDLVVEGRVVARGQLSVLDDQFAVRVTEVIQAVAK